MDRKISVILPVWNGEKYLAEAIESVLGQDYPDIELIVIDDGSTDNTQKIIERYRNQILSFAQENRGLGASRNLGIARSSGSYLAFLDHDDRWVNRKLSVQMEAMLASDAQDPLIFSHVQQFICPSLSEEEKKRLSVNLSILPAYFAGTLLMSKKRFHQIGPFVEQKQLGEFVEWYLRALELKIPIQMLKDLTLHRRVHAHNMGRQKELYQRTDYLRILKASLDRRRAHELL